MAASCAVISNEGRDPDAVKIQDLSSFEMTGEIIHVRWLNECLATGNYIYINDLCLLTETDLEQAIAYVKSCNVDIIEGPVERSGATEKLLSFYIYDPDVNLIEISTPL